MLSQKILNIRRQGHSLNLIHNNIIREKFSPIKVHKQNIMHIIDPERKVWCCFVATHLYQAGRTRLALPGVRTRTPFNVTRYASRTFPSPPPTTANAVPCHLSEMHCSDSKKYYLWCLKIITFMQYDLMKSYLRPHEAFCLIYCLMQDALNRLTILLKKCRQWSTGLSTEYR